MRAERFMVRADEMELSQCVHCTHADPNDGKCTAFPDGIPMPILRNRADHREPYEGDHGVRFEPVEGYQYQGKPWIPKRG